MKQYEWSVVPVQEWWYWHLYWKGVRINGGLADEHQHASYEAESVAYRHHRDHSMGASSAVQPRRF
jgi:hypothetical protein